MSVKDVYKLGDRERVLVHVNELNQPIKVAGGLCTRFLTTLLKQPNLCPPDATDFREVKRCGAKLLKEVREKFSLPYNDGVNKVLYANFDSKYRNLKHRLKKRLLEQATAKLDEARKQARSASGIDGEEEEIKMQYSTDELLKALDMIDPPLGFLDHQWEKVKHNLRSEKAKELSRKGKEARADQVHVRTNGSISNARKRDEFEVKNKRPPTEVETFGLIYQDKDGSYFNAKSEEFMVEVKEGVMEKRLNLASLDPLTQKFKQSLKVRCGKILWERISQDEHVVTGLELQNLK